ncbi:MAG: molybdopterin biosynthesis protein, partial [Syntrophomonadaceae bacterium]|nr:molybdopterin biosynthesis protein [Syntrophomonadaceae bacterium]
IGSHDLTIDFLIDILLKSHGPRMVSTNVGSMGGLMSLRRRETHCAGLHLLDCETGDYNRSYLDKYLPGERIMLVNLVYRQQGLIVQPGNPMGIKGLEDLSRPEIRYINRQNGAGTRLLLDYLLGLNNIDPQSVNGYNREEYTHLAVAAAVKNNASDTGMAIYASAKILALDFIPIATERYDLCIMPGLIKKSHLDALLDAIRSREFQDRVRAFGGYRLDQSGQILMER